MELKRLISVVDHCFVRGVCDECPMHRYYADGRDTCDKRDVELGEEIRQRLYELQDLLEEKGARND